VSIHHEKEFTMKTSRHLVFVIFVLTLFFAVPLFAVPIEKDAKTLFEQKCGSCHSIDKVTSKNKTEKAWLSTVQRMKKKGAAVNDEEVKDIVGYLAKNYGKK